MPAIAAAAVAGPLIGSILGSRADRKAAKNQANVDQWIYQQQSALNQPYMYAGNAALNPLMALYGINANLSTGAGTGGPVSQATPEQQAAAMNLFYQSPEYTIQKSALDQALERQASAQGVRYSPSTALGKAEISGRAFGDWRNNLASLGQMGPTGASNQASMLQNLGAGLTQAIGAQGQAKANKYVALGQGIADLAGQYGQYQAYQDRTSQLLDMLRGGGGGFDASAPLPQYRTSMGLR